MDKSTIAELAEEEVFAASQYDLNPSERDFISLFSAIPPRINDIQAAISYYTSLSEDKIEQRYSIHFWEECAIAACDTLFFDLSAYLSRSIDERELARREICSVDILLSEGKYKMLQNTEDLCINEIAPAYEKLITGTWSDFFVAKEQESFELAYEESEKEVARSLIKFRSKYKDKEMHMPSFIAWIESTKNSGPEYIDYFNLNWVAAMQVQALIWYKKVLKNISINGRPSFNHQVKGISTSEARVKNITMKTLKRFNEGHGAITSSYTDFVHKFDRKPQYGELMIFMLESPPEGFIVSGKKNGKKVSELSIEGIENSIDREAFRKRFDRYFKNTDNKQDIS